MSRPKTHREVKNPRISVRHLADYMDASETAKRTIVRSCKYQAIARIVQHDHAKAIVSDFLCNGKANVGLLMGEAQQLRDRMADDDFERDVLDHNADYVDRFAAVFPGLDLPAADVGVFGKASPLEVHGVKVSMEIHLRLRRLTKTNEARFGGAMLRYAKGKPLAAEAACWQSAFLLGYLREAEVEDGAAPEAKLCLTIDAQAGVCHPAPSDSTRRYKHMISACASIAERWPNVTPPPNAVI